MAHETIDRQEVIDLFHELMQEQAQFRVLRLLGESKVGKSHLLTKVFPSLAEHVYHANCIVIDLRDQAQSISDILHTACSLFGDVTAFPSFHQAYIGWLGRPKVIISGVQALFSRILVDSGAEANEEHKISRYLVTQFVSDLRSLNKKPILFIFDTLDRADGDILNWLMGALLVQLAQLAHVRVVLAGQIVPEAVGSYVGLCHSFELLPVEDEDEYIDYCQRVGAEVAEQSIRDIARMLDYKPGLFVDLVLPAFRRHG